MWRIWVILINNIGDVDLLRERVLFNLRKEEMPLMVRGTHLLLCHKLNIIEGMAFIYMELCSDNFGQIDKIRLLDIYIDLGGEASDMIDELKSLKEYNYWYWHLVDNIIQVESQTIIALLKNILRSKKVSEEIKLESCNRLLKYGNVAGVKYFCKLVRKYKKNPFGHDFHNFQFIKPFTDPNVLNELFKILIIPYRKKIEDESHFERLDGAITSIISFIALQDQDSFIKIIERINLFIDKHKRRYSRVLNLRYTIDSIENNYYKSIEDTPSIEKVIGVNKLLGICN